MTTFASSMQTIDLQKVLLITNNDNAQSKLDAADYISRRGLNPTHVLAFNFGTLGSVAYEQLIGTGSPAIICQTSGAYLGKSFIEAIATYILNNDIDAVILSTYTTPELSINGGGWPLAAYAGAAVYYQYYYSTGEDPVPGYYSPGVAAMVDKYPAVSGSDYWSTYRNTPTKIICSTAYNWKDSSVNIKAYRPHGRLGSPTNGSIQENTLRGGATSIYNNAVTKALTAEQVDNKGNIHAFSDSTSNINYSPYMTPAMNDVAYQWCDTIGITNRVRLNDVYPPLSGQGYLKDDPGGTPYTSFPGSIFALCVGDEFNNISNYTTLQNSFTCSNGAWGFTWTSSSFVFGNALLYNGGSAALNTISEPFAYSLAFPHEVFHYATYYKMPLMLAQFHAYGTRSPAPYRGALGFTVCGDPLYAPYKSTTFLVSPSTGTAVDNFTSSFPSSAKLASVSTPGTTNAWIPINPTQTPNWTNIDP